MYDSCMHDGMAGLWGQVPLTPVWSYGAPSIFSRPFVPSNGLIRSAATSLPEHP